eukprot:1161452-Pelagomonas_calceolata.AAC.3
MAYSSQHSLGLLIAYHKERPLIFDLKQSLHGACTAGNQHSEHAPTVPCSLCVLHGSLEIPGHGSVSPGPVSSVCLHFVRLNKASKHLLYLRSQHLHTYHVSAVQSTHSGHRDSQQLCEVCIELQRSSWHGARLDEAGLFNGTQKFETTV